MKLFVATGLACITLAGCGSFHPPTAVTGVECEGSRCDALWQRAQTWLATHGRYRIQIANDSVIQTYGPHDGVFDAVAFTLTKERQVSGKTLIAIRGSCYGTVYGCVIDPVPLTNQLYLELSKL